MSQNDFKTSETIQPQEASLVKSPISVLGIDIAKRIFHVVGMNERGQIVLRKRLSRHDLMPFIATLPPVLIGMEACGGAHYWARRFREHGHEVKLMAPQFVKPYVKSNKNDMRDAEGIGEAVTRPTMRFVPTKAVDQQDLQALHRVRERLIGARTALVSIHVRRDSRSSIAYAEELISATMSATLQSTDRHDGIVGQACCHFQLDL
jgi:transposase